MLITKQNLAICSHCANGPDTKGRALNNLQITGNGTVVTNGYYSLAVSAVESSDFGSPVLISPESASDLLRGLGDHEGTLERGIAEVRLLTGKITLQADIVEGKFPILEGYKEAEVPVFEMTLDVKYLLAIVRQMAEFGGEVARVRFFSPMEPVRLDTRNIGTGQNLEALIMGRKPGWDKHLFEPPAPVVPVPPAEPQDEFARAMADAAKLMGQ